MDIKKLAKATKALEQIKVLDTQIIEINKYAMTIADEDTKITFNFKVEILQKEGEEKVTFDEDGSLCTGGSPRTPTIFGSLWDTINREKENKNEHTLEDNLTVRVSLEILGIILREKEAQRQLLIDELSKNGIII